MPIARGEDYQVTDTKTEPIDVSKMVFEGPGKILVKETSDWKIASVPRYFGPNNLFDLINGGAEIYRDFGLVKMVTADFRSSPRKTLTVTVEIYDQGSQKGAFGRMARFLTGRADPSNAGQGLPPDLADKGIFSGSDLVFYKDRYLVHITLLDESPDATVESMTKAGKEILPGFAAAIGTNIKTNPPPLKVLSLFPEAHQIGRSHAYDSKDTAGIENLGPGYTVRYKNGDKTWTLFATEAFGDKSVVKTKLDAYSKTPIKKEKTIFSAADNRIVGFIAGDETWTEADLKPIAGNIESLKKAISSL